MKIILSRKGFDRSYGGFASPIFEDGTMYSIPIPEDHNVSLSYADLDYTYKGERIQDILNDLTNKKIYIKDKLINNVDFNSKNLKCHMDPMIIKHESFNGIAFGQSEGPESHLRNKKIKQGDIFLFFGWFREVEKDKSNGKWKYKEESKDLHVIWGFMEVGEIIYIDDMSNKEIEILKQKYMFLNNHPHLEINYGKPNTIYLSKRYKIFDFAEKRVLTETRNYKGRSIWKLTPLLEYPEAMSYIKEENINKNSDNTTIKSPYIGQEFVLDLEQIGNDKDKVLRFIDEIVDGL